MQNSRLHRTVGKMMEPGVIVLERKGPDNDTE